LRQPALRALLLSLGVTSTVPATLLAQGKPVALAATRSDGGDLRVWDEQIDRMIRSRDLRVRESVRDTLVPGRIHERFDQYFHGVRIFGGDITRQTDATGTVSTFGMLHTDIDVTTTPRLSVDPARDAIGAAASGEPSGAEPELVVLPLSDGYHLAYFGQAFDGVEILNVFVDASSGALLRKYSDFLSEGVVVSGVGTYGDQKKVSVKPLGGAFVADDGLRPAAITTYDLKGNLVRLTSILNRVTPVAASDIASNGSDKWTDGTVVDGHVYAGWYYDYLFRRFGRNGLDNNNLRMPVFTHPVRLEDIGTAPSNIVGTYYLNAFSCGTCGPDGRGAVVFGEGAPRGYVAPGIEVKPFSAALDVVAHELTHNVTAVTARLNGFPYSEAGALNEGFSDIFGTATAFFHEPAGNGPLQASYMQGRDLSVPGGALGRSLSNPASTRDPDHYSLRIIGADPHYNSTIASHAFYLAIEGGTNRSSGQTVPGVGAANREQIEKVFFRALTTMMPSSSTFALTRATTIQAARDLYGSGGAVERAVTQAWDAVGVQPREAPTATMLPNPARARSGQCGAVPGGPVWDLGVTVSAGTSSLRITGWDADSFDHTGALQRSVRSGIDFAQAFTQCGPGSDRVVAQTDACAAFCLFLLGDRNGSAQITFRATDDSGQTVTFSTPRVTLVPPQ
jgi:Zn-dependent metalloprotease